MSSALLMNKHKCGIEVARHILKIIVDNYENVQFRTKDQIYIEGRELEAWKPKLKRNRTRVIKPSRWKDVTKP